MLSSIRSQPVLSVMGGLKEMQVEHLSNWSLLIIIRVLESRTQKMKCLANVTMMIVQTDSKVKSENYIEN